MSKAASTRRTILEKAFELIYTRSYQTTSIDDILATTGVTKGAFYYHFKNKDEMGAAIVDELLRPVMLEQFILPVKNAEDPLGAIYDLTHALLLENPMLKPEYGCPAGNFTAEMTPWNEVFHTALSGLMNEWLGAISFSITRAKENGLVRASADPQQAAIFLVSGYWGVRDLGKLMKTPDCYENYLAELRVYLEELKG
jgi:TetR/AcrR family transcriptional regulator, transcriptional repressor for nem operon